MGRDAVDGRVWIYAERSSDGNSVVIRVVDNGPGMSEEVRQRCLEPFFTTRSRGISTGLGLALVHGAVTNAKGRVEVATAPGKGTTFTITLPAEQDGTSNATTRTFSGAAAIGLADTRVAAYVSSMLKSIGIPIQADVLNTLESPGPHILILHDAHGLLDKALNAARSDATTGVVVFADRLNGESHPRIARLAHRATASQIRTCIRQVTSAVSAAQGLTV
jgi:hypothetical protein